MKELLKMGKNLEAYGMKEYIRNYIDSILKENGERALSQNGFQIMQNYIATFTENIDPYINILKKYRESFSLLVLEGLIMGQNPHEFERFCEKGFMKKILQNTKNKNLEIFLSLYNIKSPEEFELLSSLEGINFILYYVKGKNLEIVMRLYKIETPEELKSLRSNWKIVHVLSYAQERNLETIMKLYDIKTSQEFEKLCLNTHIVKILSTKEKNFETILTLFQIKTSHQLELLFQYEHIIESLDASEKVFAMIIKYCRIENYEVFENLCSDVYVIHILKNAKEKNLEIILRLYDINAPEAFKSLCNDKRMRIFLICVNEKNLEQFMKFHGIETVSDFERKIYNDTSIRYILESKLCIEYDSISTLYENIRKLGYNNIRGDELGELSNSVLQHKRQPNKNEAYVGNSQIWGSFSLLDKTSDRLLTENQESGQKLTIRGIEKYFTVNGGTEYKFYTNIAGISPKKQILINRIFSPYLSMTRLLTLKDINGSSLVVSVDVNDSQAENILKHNDDTSEKIQIFLRYVYQFLAKDFDRHGSFNFANGIIYDFDMAQSLENNFSRDTLPFPKNITLEEEQDFANILYFFRQYVIGYCDDMLQSSEKDSELQELWISLRSQAYLLSALNLGMSTYSIEEEDLKQILSIDKKLTEKYNQS